MIERLMPEMPETPARPAASTDVAARLATDLSEEFFNDLVLGAQLGTFTAADVRTKVLDRVRATLDVPDDGATRAFVTLQPIVHLESNAVIGYEATVAFSHEGPGAVSEIERGATRSAAMQIDAVRAALGRIDEVPRGQFLAVKVSGAGLQHDSLAPTLLAANVDRLVVEISEGTAADIGTVREGIDSLARIGVRSAIDGAGVGLFRGASLYEVSPALLRIDPSIVDGCAEDDDKRVQIEKLIAIGRRLGALVVASGVDTRESLAAVFLLGVDAAQGSCVQTNDVVVSATAGWSESRVESDEASARQNTESVFSLTKSV
jgi:EAL domain-containing protein (putative c-di-GMP-specific phosphodiesterase class I)